MKAIADVASIAESPAAAKTICTIQPVVIQSAAAIPAETPWVELRPMT